MDNVNRILPSVQDTHVPVGSLLTVTIGRNVRAGYSELAALGQLSGEQVPMRRKTWNEFQNQVRLEFIGRASDVFGPFHGTGEWDGVTEESAVFTAIVSTPFPPAEFDAAMARLASLYDQDAIAWSYGEARLARP